jgi:hypothetical protein
MDLLSGEPEDHPSAVIVHSPMVMHMIKQHSDASFLLAK